MNTQPNDHKSRTSQTSPQLKTRLKRTTRKRKPATFDYKTLEPKQMLAADLSPAAPVPRTTVAAVPDASYQQTLVGNYRQDFLNALSGNNSNWNYYWNAPDNWSNFQPGNLDSGSIDDTTSYQPLLRGTKLFRPTGVNDISSAAGHLLLNSKGGHTGIHAGLSTGSTFDRYAIAAFTVDESGYYSISDSFVSKSRPNGDGVEVIVRVGSDPFAQRVSIEPGTQYRTDFDTNLGFLEAGETIYVAAGATGDHAYDRFAWNFSIYQFTGAEVTEFGSEMSAQARGSSGGSNWTYLWNAPDGWNGSEDPGLNQMTGRIGEIENYRPMTLSNGRWTSGGSANDVASRHMALSGSFSHVGSGGDSVDSVDRYVIAKYTFDESGFYAITDSQLMKTGTTGNGIELVIHNEAGEMLQQQIVNPLNSTAFDGTLGFRAAGESIYVAIGPDGSDTGDGFQIDFDIVAEPMVRAEPMLELNAQATFHVDDFGAIADDNVDDHLAIQRTIDAAISIQQSTGQAVEVVLGRGTYRLGQRDANNLEIRFANDLKFTGQGAGNTELLLTDARAGLMRIMDSEDVLVTAFSVDYESLPFTQGSVIRVVDDFTAILKVDAGYSEPDGPELFSGELTTHRTQFVSSARNGRLVNGSDFYKSDSGSTVRNSNGTYTVTYDRGLPSRLAAGDAWYQIARINSRSNFGLARNTGHISFIGIDSYASTSGFIQGQDNEMVDVINNRVMPKPGRLVSHLGDMVHVQRSTVGPWVEGNRFTGPSDDIAHVYRFIDSELGAQLSPNQFLIIDGKDLHAGEELLFARQDGYRQTANIRSIVGNVLTTDEPIRGYTTDTDVVPLDRTSRGSVFRDNVFGCHRAGRGALAIFSPEATVIGNHFQSINSHAIHASGYQPYSISTGLVIAGNSFRDIGFKSQLAPIALDQNINDWTLIDNEFVNTFGETEITDGSSEFGVQFFNADATNLDASIPGDELMRTLDAVFSVELV